MAHHKHAHCSYCGSPYPEGVGWPRSCSPCGNISYLNPLPVAVAVVPVEGGVLCVRRTIPPAVGQIALPGGFLEAHETWQEGCARELREETGLVIDPGEVSLFRAHSAAPHGLLLIFGLARPHRRDELPPFLPNDEASETVIVPGPVELAFPLHSRVLADYFASVQ